MIRFLLKIILTCIGFRYSFGNRKCFMQIHVEECLLNCRSTSGIKLKETLAMMHCNIVQNGKVFCKVNKGKSMKCDYLSQLVIKRKNSLSLPYHTFRKISFIPRDKTRKLILKKHTLVTIREWHPLRRKKRGDNKTPYKPAQLLVSKPQPLFH